LTHQVNSITLFAADPLEEMLTLTLLDATGRAVYGGVWLANSDKIQIDNTALPPGLYIIRLSNEHANQVLRYIR